MVRTWCFLKFGVLGAALLGFPLAGHASVITISSSTPQSGFNGYSPSGSFPLTAGAYNFGSQAQNLGSIDSLSVTLTLGDGDSAAGDFDFGNLTLGLDGIDTGLQLNGFANDDYEPNQPITLTFSGTPNNAAQILAALQADGQLVGSILDSDDETGTGNGDNLLQIPGGFNTNLSLTGQFIPEPTTLLVLGLGSIAVAGYSLRRRMKPSA